MIHLLRLAVGTGIMAVLVALIMLVMYISMFENLVTYISYGVLGLLFLGAVYLAGLIFIAEYNGDI